MLILQNEANMTQIRHEMLQKTVLERAVLALYFHILFVGEPLNCYCRQSAFSIRQTFLFFIVMRLPLLTESILGLFFSFEAFEGFAP